MYFWLLEVIKNATIAQAFKTKTILKILKIIREDRVGVLGGPRRYRRLGRSRFYQLVLAPLTTRERIALGVGLFSIFLIFIVPNVLATTVGVGAFMRIPAEQCQAGAGWSQANQATGQPDAFNAEGVYDTNKVAYWYGGGDELECTKFNIPDQAILNPSIGLSLGLDSTIPQVTESSIDASDTSAQKIDQPDVMVSSELNPNSGIDDVLLISFSVDSGVNWKPLHYLDTSSINQHLINLPLPPQTVDEFSKMILKVSVVNSSSSFSTVVIDSVFINYEIGQSANMAIEFEDNLNAQPLLGANQKTLGKLKLKVPGSNTLSGIKAMGSKLIGQDSTEPDTSLDAYLVDTDGQTTTLQVNGDWQGTSIDGGYAWDLNYEPPRSLDPGTYTLVTKVVTADGQTIEQTQSVLYGVVAFNYQKSSYAVGENARFLMTVLDERGASICDASILIKIKNQDGATIADLSSNNNQIKVTDTCSLYGTQIDPDYEAIYAFGTPGQYDINIDISTSTTVYHLRESILVSDNQPFVITRTGPTRIYPINPYFMKISLLASEDFNGQIKEYIPSNFKLVSTPDQRPYSINKLNDQTTELIWDVEIKNGEEIELSYKFDAPDISPEFYTLGPLTLNDTSARFSEPRVWQLAGDAIGRMILFYDGATIPTGWTCVSCTTGDPFYQVFPRGNDTYGGTGGATTHNHTASATVALTGSAGATNNQSGSTLSANTHTHDASVTLTAASNLPGYRNLKIIRNDIAGEPATLPSGAIGIFDTTVPSGWSQYSAQDNYYLRGENTIITGGNNTHTHPENGNVNTATGSTFGVKTGGSQSSAAVTGHTHTFSGDSTNGDNEPPYVSVIFGQLGTSAAPPDNLITMWDDTVPSNWAKQSDTSGAYYQKFFKGSNSYGATGGDTSHGHISSIFTSTGPSGTPTGSRTATDTASSVHTHDVTVDSYSTDNHLPPYRDVIIGKRVPQPDVGQSAYRLYQNTNSTDVGSPLANQDTAGTAPKQGVAFRLRMMLHISNTNLDTGNRNFKLQYSQRSGTCDTSFSGESYVDVLPSSGTIRYYDNSTPSDGDALTANTNDPSHGHTKRSQTYEEFNNFTNSISTVNDGEDGMWDFALMDYSAPASTNYCFRAVRSNDELLQSYSVIPEITTDDGSGHMLLMYDGASVPSGWTCVSCNPSDDFYQRFFRGAATYGSTGGNAAHTHTTNNSLANTASLTIEDQAGSGLSTGAHTHTISPIIDSPSLLPTYRQLKIIRADLSGVPTTIPSGVIALYDNTVPSGWTQYSAQDGNYIRGENTVGSTGGNLTHSHSITGTTSSGNGTTSARTVASIPAAIDNHTHTINGSTPGFSHEPLFRQTILGQANSDTTLPQNIITLWDGPPPGSWTDMSSSGQPFYQNFIKPTSTYGTTGGSSTHTHADLNILSSVPSSTSNYRTGTINADGSHAHTVSISSFSTENNLPPYIDVIIAKMGALNTAPDNPTNLDQIRTSDISSISIGGWTNGGQVRFEADATDTDNPDTLQLCIEVELTSTAFDGVDTACGTGFSYTGSAVTVSANISGLINDGSTYHWQARIKDGGGGVSNWVSFGANLESATDFANDATAPEGLVYDGTNSGVDVDFNNGVLNSLSANWNITDSTSGIAEYQYSIGTSAGGTDIKTWTSNGTNNSVTASSLTLQTSTVYYFNIRAYDNANNESTISSDGLLVAPTLSFSTAPNGVSFSNLNISNGYSDTKTTTLTTSTNAYNGYEIRAYATGLLTDLQSNTINFFNGGSYATPDEWLGGDIGFGYTSNDTTIQEVNKFGGSPCAGGGNPPCYAPFSTLAPGDIVADHTTLIQGTPVSDENFIISHKVKVSNIQPAGTYSTNIIFSVTARY